MLEFNKGYIVNNLYLNAVSMRRLAMCLAWMLVFAGVTVFVDQEKTSAVATIPNKLSYTSHTPIIIHNDTDFLSPGNGVTSGTGTALDPYIIEGWDIQVTLWHTSLSISGTSAHYVVRNCHINKWVSFSNASNGKLINNTFYDGNIGIYSSSHMFISENNFTNIKRFILNNMDDTVVMNNYLSMKLGGSLDVEDTRNTSFWNNTFINGGITLNWHWGNLGTIVIDLNNTVNGKPIRYYRNTPSLSINQSTSIGQLIIHNCTDLSLTNLNISNTSSAIQIGNTTNVHISHVNVSNSYNGIMLTNSNNVFIVNSSGWGNLAHGLELYTTSNSTFDNITLIRNGHGIAYWSGDHVVFTNSIIKWNVDGGLFQTTNTTFNNISSIENQLNGLEITYDNVVVGNSTFNGNGQGFVNYAVAEAFHVHNSSFTDNVNGIYTQKTNNIVISDCEFTSNNIGIYSRIATNASIANCTFNDSDIGIYDFASHNNHITRNSIGNSTHTYYSERISFLNQLIYQNDPDYENYSSIGEQCAIGQQGSEPLYTRSFNITNASWLSIQTIGDSDVIKLSTCLFLDGGYGNPKDGVTQAGEAIYSSDMDLQVDYPRDGTYLLRIFGSNITSSPAQFDLYVNVSCVNSTGVRLEWANTYVNENIICGNRIGIYSWDITSNCYIYHNNFFDNDIHAVDLEVDVWDNGILSGGNYWDNWTSPDINHDGYVDSPYAIYAGNRDKYPFADPWTVDNTAPVANAGPDQDVKQAEVIWLNGSSSSDNVGIVNYSWLIQRPNMSNITAYGANANITLLRVANYSVNLTVLDAAGNTDYDVAVVHVIDAGDPDANAGPDQTINQGDTVRFNGSQSTSTLQIANYTWSFEYNGSAVKLNGSLAQYKFFTVGNYSVTLNVTDIAGDSGHDTMTVIVRDSINPVAKAGADFTIGQGDICTFNGSRSTDNIGITNDTWNFEYNETAQNLYGAVSQFRFYTLGNYQINLTVRDSGGNIGSDVLVVTVVDNGKPLIIDYKPTGCNVSISTHIEVTFNEPMNTSTVEDSFSISPSITNVTYIWDDDNTTVLINSTILVPGTTYSITISGNSTDKNGNTLGTPFSWNFTTKPDGTQNPHSGNEKLIIILALIIIVIVIILIYYYKRRNMGKPLQ